MRTNIAIYDQLIHEVFKLRVSRPKKDAVEYASKTVIKLKRQERIRGHRIPVVTAQGIIANGC
jgi:hypothetical protein